MSNQIYASIDIGTNSTLLLVAEYQDGHFHPVRNEVEITRLGQEVGNTERLHNDAMERTIATLRKYRQICNNLGVEDVIIGGTSAMRDAENGPAFIRQVQNELGWNVRILTGDDEARLTFLATRYEFSDISGDYLVLDIGGGSTEFICGNRDGYQIAKSLDVGTVRFTEQYIANDPPASAELEAARRVVRRLFSSELNGMPVVSDRTTLIGVAGTVTTLLAVEKEMNTYIPEQIHKQPLSRRQIDNLLNLFCSVPLEQRKQLPGLQPQRADVIIMGTVILQEVMRNYGFDRLIVSDRGVRYGLLYDHIF